jgi:predicted 3-demethylubiquinone-9 3-methyltransferase (glyoxalase superfamily)
MTEQKITPCLWFDSNAEQAVVHYLSIFPNSRILSTARYGEFAPDRKGAVMTVFFEIDGQRFLALNGGPHYKFTPAISLMVNCDDQAEIDALWEKLAEGGEHVECGWLTDKFGVSWQIVPRILPERGRQRRAHRSRHARGHEHEEARHCANGTGRRAQLGFERNRSSAGATWASGRRSIRCDGVRHGQRHLRFLRLPRSNERSWRGERADRPAAK